jgi:DNA primase
MPIAWEDLGDIDPAAFRIATAGKTMEGLADPWAAFLGLEQSVERAVGR